VPAAPPPFPRRDEPGWLLRARVAQASGDRAALVRVLGDAIDRPATRACRYPAAIALLEQEGARDEALGLARAFAAEDPARPAALLAVGRLELATGDDPAAALDFEGFVYHSVDRAAAFGEVARALDAGGRTRAACVTRRRAVAMRGGADPPTLLALGACLARDRQAPAADEVLARYLRLSPPAERARARREIVAAWSRAGDVARARAAAGDDPAAPVHLEGAAVPVALRALEAAAPRRPLDATLFARRAELHAAAGQADRALALLGRARAIRPDHPVVLATAARLLPGLTGPDAEPALLALALTGSAVVRCEADLGLARLYRDQRHAALAAAARRRLAACHDPDVRARAAALDAGAPAAR
jgi:tetratricopeptide (TPR) repeat protein